MKNIKLYFLIFTTLFLFTCKEEKTGTDIPDQPKVISEEYIDDLLFVNKNNYQIQTSEPATFSASNSHITISPSGLIERLTSGELVTIDVTWTNTGTKTKLFALGATDDNHVNPFIKYQAADSDNPYGQYLQGWKTLQKLPVTNETYFVVLRHADADDGTDWSVKNDGQGPEDWWKSCDNTLARQLNQQGIERATELGKVFKDLNYPVTRVIASEFCRAVKTAQLMNLGPEIKQDGRINHPAYLRSGKPLFIGLQGIIKEQPVDNKMTLISTHHPINEFNNSGIPTFSKVSAFNWTGAYFVKVNVDQSFTYEGAASWGMFKYWRDKKLGRL